MDGDVAHHPSLVEGGETDERRGSRSRDGEEHLGGGGGNHVHEENGANDRREAAEEGEHDEDIAADGKIRTSPVKPILAPLKIDHPADDPDTAAPSTTNKPSAAGGPKTSPPPKAAKSFAEEPPLSPTLRESATLDSLRRRICKIFKAAGGGRADAWEESSAAPVWAMRTSALEPLPVAGVLDFYNFLKKSASYGEDGAVSNEDMRRALDAAKICLTDEEVCLVKEHYSKDNSARIPLETFLLDCAGGISRKRLAMVRYAFQLVDVDGNGAVHVQDIKAEFRAAEHPRVKSGELTAERLWNEFVSYFELDRPDGMVYPVEWEFHYAEISSQIATDDYFEHMMFACWPGLKKEHKGGALTFKDKRRIASKFRKLDLIVNDHRTFRDALSLAFYRADQPGDHHLSPQELHRVVSEVYRICGIAASEVDEATFDAIHRRVLREAGLKASTVTDYEAPMRDALLRECTFLEYQLYAVTV